MGAHYSFHWYWHTFHNFMDTYSRATDLALNILGIDGCDLISAWQKDPKSWERFKEMVHDLARFEAETSSQDLAIAKLQALKESYCYRWVKKGLLNPKRTLDIMHRMNSLYRAPIEKGSEEGTPTEEPYLQPELDFGGPNERVSSGSE